MPSVNDKYLLSEFEKAELLTLFQYLLFNFSLFGIIPNLSYPVLQAIASMMAFPSVVHESG